MTAPLSAPVDIALSTRVNARHPGVLPDGLWEYAEVLGLAVEARLGAVVGDVTDWVDAPARLGAPHAGAAPQPWGDGALCVDLGPDDGDTWQHFCGAMTNGGDVAERTAGSAQQASVEAVAAQAQEWRLAVTPYRKLRPAGGGASSEALAQPEPASLVGGERRGSLAGVTVVDLTTMWAGPLCTQLLVRAGARVVKVEPSVRPDGLRGSPEHFRQLNDGKELVDLDLRDPDQRRTFDGYLAVADLLVTSMSRRALVNLRLAPSQLATDRSQPPSTLAITAYDDDSPEADWIAYGSGVHATSGLGWLDAEPQPCAFSYPDPLAGLCAAATAADLLSKPRPSAATVSLAAAVEPLALAAHAARPVIESR